MPLPSSTRYVTIRDSLFTVLTAHANLSGLVGELKTLSQLQNASEQQMPAMAVRYSDVGGQSRALVGGAKRYDRRYTLEVVFIVANFQPDAALDLLLRHLETAENIIAGNPTLSGDVSGCFVERMQPQLGQLPDSGAWIAQGALLVNAQKAQTI